MAVDSSSLVHCTLVYGAVLDSLITITGTKFPGPGTSTLATDVFEI